jgi:UDP-2,4-diacetamido-2,4,6-trideoxy-beta-L-altropyranose hydrolase
MESLVIRADASTKMGTGHLMRCLALGQAWQDAGGEVIFITACQNEALLNRLKLESFDVHKIAAPHPDPADLDYTKGILNTHSNTWLVLDGYHFDKDYQKKVKKEGHRLLVIDDMAHLKHYYAGIVLNQNLHAEQLHYSCEPDTNLLLGSRYVLLRREFLKWEDWQREIPEVAKKVLVTMGGVDAKNHTSSVVKALQQIDVPGLEVTVVIGTNNPYADVLEAAAGQSSVPISIVRNVKNMPQLMAEADAAICSAGTTVWELAFMGVPTIAVAITSIEEYLIDGLCKNGLFASLNWVNSFSEVQLADPLKKLIMDREARHNISQLGRKFVDGCGCDRVIKHLLI